jgi:hypothetical protein
MHFRYGDASLRLHRIVYTMQGTLEYKVLFEMPLD